MAEFSEQPNPYTKCEIGAGFFSLRFLAVEET
jgi:hypothetical protein